jgi:hypothetical protein
MKKVTKKELVNDILTVLKWNDENNNEYGKKINIALGNVTWYMSYTLMERVLMRQTIEDLKIIRNQIVEAIY